MANKEAIVVFDMGATHTRVAASTDGSTLSDPLIFETASEFEPGIKLLSAAIKQASKNEPIRQIVGGVSGVLDHNHATLEQSLNLPNWTSKPIKNLLEDTFGIRVNLHNDTEMVGLGEAVGGAGKDRSIIAYITISTGVGGVKIINQTVDQNASGFEVGYHFMSTDSTGQPMSFEQAVGGHALSRRFGKSPQQLAQDPVIWDQAIQSLAIGVHNTILFWSPELIVFGGGMMRDIPLDKLHHEVGKLLTAFPKPPEFRLAELGDMGGLLGALTIAKGLGNP